MLFIKQACHFVLFDAAKIESFSEMRCKILKMQKTTLYLRKILEKQY